MFEIRCIVADKRLSEALRALGGLTLEPPVVLAVTETNQVGHNGQAKQRGNVPGGSTTQVMKYLSEKKLKKVTAAQLSGMLVDMGYSANGYSYALKRLIEKGVLKPAKEPHTYEVMKHG